MRSTLTALTLLLVARKKIVHNMVATTMPYHDAAIYFASYRDMRRTTCAETIETETIYVTLDQ